MVGASNPPPIASHQIKDYGGGLRPLLPLLREAGEKNFRFSIALQWHRI